jgi:hypothetical protein
MYVCTEEGGGGGGGGITMHGISAECLLKCASISCEVVPARSPPQENEHAGYNICKQKRLRRS